jgi:hypothetical protein
LGALVSFDEYGHEHTHKGLHPCYQLLITNRPGRNEMKGQKKETPNKNRKKLLGLYKLPSKSDWNEGMAEDEKRDFIDSMIKDMAGKLEEDSNE